MIKKLPIQFNDIAIGIIWLFHLCGILGILYGDSQWFVGATPINLLLSFLLLMITSRRSTKVFIVAIIAFIVGMVAEALGVNYGLIFGHYQYGEALGWKVAGVPWLIGVNWSILVICCGAIAADLAGNFYTKVLLGVGLMLLLDFVIEPIAPILDFWEFTGGVAPLQNYIGWLAIALPLHIIYHGLKIELKGNFTHHLFLLQIIFFTILLLQINTLQNAL
ncbi:MAG: carotenoid biosynthesis protein [Candidatus Arcticimaribacter sp.]